MTPSEFVSRIATKRRAPLVAAAVALLAALPSLFTLPPMDRDESRFAEASAQMLESGDFTDIMFQEEPREKKPVGVYWLQAASVAAFSSPARRDIWAYRLPSLLGAMLAAGACAWGALAFLEPPGALLAGVLLPTTLVLSTEAILATTDAALCGAVTLAMAALARIYLSAQGGPIAGVWTRTLFWLGLAAATLLKGPIGPMIAALTLLALVAWDRKAGWLARLGWDWGVILFAGLVLPWALAITVATDGAFWGAAVGGDLAPKLVGGQEGHGAPPGYFVALSGVLLFPAVLLLPAAAVAAWRKRATPAVRFAVCWLVPSWIVFELVPTKLPHYTLPLLGAVAWLMAAAAEEPVGVWARRTGAGFLAAVAVGLAVAGCVAANLFGAPVSWAWAAAAAALLAATATAGGMLLLDNRARAAASWAALLGLAAHSVLTGALAPSLERLWLSERVVAALTKAGVNPRQGLAEGPVTVAGYQEPSLVFLLGTTTVLGSADDAAKAIAEGRPAVVEARETAAFQHALAADAAAARVIAVIRGLDYSSGRTQVLTVYQSAAEDPARPA
jgi:4-amino-4-deoxy-L-arabinose transferase-like glycosyltransferase